MSQTVLEVEIAVDESVADEVPPDCTIAAITAAVRAAAATQGFHIGEIGIRLTDDRSIHAINQAHLDHDYPTDVISFGYEACRPRLEGEMIVSVQTAASNAMELDQPTTREILLYVVHGTLHIAGLNDRDEASAAAMRSAEAAALDQLPLDSPPSPRFGERGLGGEGSSPDPEPTERAKQPLTPQPPLPEAGRGGEMAFKNLPQLGRGRALPGCDRA